LSSHRVSWNPASTGLDVAWPPSEGIIDPPSPTERKPSSPIVNKLKINHKLTISTFSILSANVEILSRSSLDTSSSKAIILKKLKRVIRKNIKEN